MTKIDLINFIDDFKRRLNLPNRWSDKAYQILVGFDGGSIEAGYDDYSEAELAIEIYNCMIALKTLSSNKIADEVSKRM